jgi:hypothetical protein
VRVLREVAEEVRSEPKQDVDGRYQSLNMACVKLEEVAEEVAEYTESRGGRI